MIAGAIDRRKRGTSVQPALLRSPAMPESGASIEVETDKLCRSFGGQVVLRDIDLKVSSGEIVCVVGGSGSGKTVLLHHLIGLLAPSSGRVLAADHNAGPGADGGPTLVDLADLSDEELDMIRLHWAVVFQSNALFSGSVRENIALWLREHTTLSPEEIEKRVVDSLRSVALKPEEVIDKDRDELSGGMAKRVAIARAIACDPLVMFYDEPTTGLDPVIAGTIHELVWKTHNMPAGEGLPLRDVDAETDRIQRESRAKLKRTTIIVTHDRELLRRLAPRVVMLAGTRKVFDGPYAAFGASSCPEAEAYLREMPVLNSMAYRGQAPTARPPHDGRT